MKAVWPVGHFLFIKSSLARLGVIAVAVTSGRPKMATTAATTALITAAYVAVTAGTEKTTVTADTLALTT